MFVLSTSSSCSSCRPLARVRLEKQHLQLDEHPELQVLNVGGPLHGVVGQLVRYRKIQTSYRCVYEGRRWQLVEIRYRMGFIAYVLLLYTGVTMNAKPPPEKHT